MAISVSVSTEVDVQLLNMMCHDVLFEAQDVKWDRITGSATLLLSWPKPCGWLHHIVNKGTESVKLVMLIRRVQDYSAHRADVEDWIKDVIYSHDSDGTYLTFKAVKGSTIRLKVYELDISLVNPI